MTSPLEIQDLLTRTGKMLCLLEKQYALRGGALVFADVIVGVLDSTHEFLTDLYETEPTAEIAEALQMIEPHREYAHDRLAVMTRTLH